MSYHRGNSSHSHSHSHHPNQYYPVSAATPSTPTTPYPSTYPPNNASEIIPRLYVSDLTFAENAASLSFHRITHILTVMPDRVCQPPLPMQPMRMQVRVEDMPFAELAAHLPSTTAFIRDALNSSPDTRVLVHCGEGISRSVSVVAGFLMAQYGWGRDEAVNYIKSKRRVANPNFGFMGQLQEYAEKSLGRGVVVAHPPSTSMYMGSASKRYR
jgi:protein-tyrosine phosphatase